MFEKHHPVTHVIFDMDGLLHDTEAKYQIAINNICDRYGSNYTIETKLKTMGKTARDAAQTVITTCNLPITVDEFLSQQNEHTSKLLADADFMPGAKKLVEHLALNGIPIAIATSNDSGTVEKHKNGEKSEFFSFFRHVVTGSDDPEVKRGKPSPDIFLVAANRFRGESKPESMKSVLVFEDSIAGVKAGLAAGMQVVWVPDPCLDTNLQEATLILRSLEEFKPESFHLPPYN